MRWILVVIGLVLVAAMVAVPVSATTVNVTWNASQSSPECAWTTIDGLQNVTPPVFGLTSPWKDVGRVTKGGQTMVHYPKFWKNITYDAAHNWFIYSVSDVNITDYQVHPAFISDGHELNAVYLGAYEAAVYDVSTSTYNHDDSAGVDYAAVTGDYLSSYPGLKPASGRNNSLTLPRFRTLAQNRNAGAIYNQSQGWQLQTFQQVSMIELLYITEFANWNSQAMIGAGVTNLASGAGNEAVNTGSTATLGNVTGNATAWSAQGLWTYPVSYRGLENPYGNIWKWVDGINIKADRNPWVADHGFASDVFAAPYTNTGLTLPNAEGYQKNLSYITTADWVFLPSSSAGGSDSTYITDYYSQTTGNRAALLGGYWNNGASAGAFYWHLAYAASDVRRAVGARISYIPVPANATFTTNVTAGSAPLAVQFTNTSIGDQSTYFWDFGDGTNSTLASPDHTFASVGSYTVSLTVTGDGGTDTITETINATDIIAQFTPTSPKIWVDNSLSINSTSIGPGLTYNWSHGDGTYAITQNTTHNWTPSGTYIVNLTISNAASTNFTVTNVTVAPSLDFTASSTYLVGLPALVLFTDNTDIATSWLWNFGDGVTDTSESPAHIYSGAGTYTAILNASSGYANTSVTKTDYITTKKTTADYIEEAQAEYATNMDPFMGAMVILGFIPIILGIGLVMYGLTHGDDPAMPAYMIFGAISLIAGILVVAVFMQLIPTVAGTLESAAK